jgi:hypothetical protein
MIRSGTLSEVNRESGDWLFVDLGFSRASRSCGILLGNGLPEEITFGQLLNRVTQAARHPGRQLCLLLEAPLSVAFTPHGNPTGRSLERRGAKTRYWYAGLGTAVLTAATYLLRAITASPPGRDILLFEGFASFKPKGQASSHTSDVTRLREVVWRPATFTAAIVSPEQIAADPQDILTSAFAVAGMDYGIPPIVRIDV